MHAVLEAHEKRLEGPRKQIRRADRYAAELWRELSRDVAAAVVLLHAGAGRQSAFDLQRVEGLVLALHACVDDWPPVALLHEAPEGRRCAEGPRGVQREVQPAKRTFRPAVCPATLSSTTCLRRKGEKATGAHRAKRLTQLWMPGVEESMDAGGGSGLSLRCSRSPSPASSAASLQWRLVAEQRISSCSPCHSMFLPSGAAETSTRARSSIGSSPAGAA